MLYSYIHCTLSCVIRSSDVVRMVISQCHMLAYLEAINHIFVFPEELVLPFFKSWATCVYYKDMGKRWYILVVLKHCSTRNLYHEYPLTYKK
ncbi:uncharacterized protein LOC114385066 isoform X4 [Glycine soja]|uniref:uncharacterized protein LOC114385066 isoform X4 n=1 Tax=Glycine soja TaxID=3848 RepID=UPI001038AF87|nr:uncharacterized protein LOC114385066 isoform X4 [Glycine soja]